MENLYNLRTSSPTFFTADCPYRIGGRRNFFPAAIGNAGGAFADVQTLYRTEGKTSFCEDFRTDGLSFLSVSYSFTFFIFTDFFASFLACPFYLRTWQKGANEEVFLKTYAFF